MKRWLPLFLLTLLLVSCGMPSASPLAPTAALIPSATVLPTIIPTASALPLNVSPDVKTALIEQKALNPDGTLNTVLIHSDKSKKVELVAESITVVKSTDTSVTEIVTGLDKDGKRYIWNAEANAWISDLVLSQEWAKPDTAPFLEVSGFEDGSANLIVALYYAEHPELISETAIMPYWKLKVGGTSRENTFYTITLYRGNQHQFTGPQETKLRFNKADVPYGFPGIIRTKDSVGREIVVMTQVRRNPKAGDINSHQTINLFMGSDRAAYDEYLNENNSGYDMITGTVTKFWREMVPVFPPPTGTMSFNPSGFKLDGPEQSPAVVEDFVRQNQIELFSADEQAQLIKIFTDYTSGRFHNDVPEDPLSVAVIELPAKLNHTIVLLGLVGWAMEPQ